MPGVQDGSTMTDLAASCADIATWLPIAQALTTEPDTDGTP